MLNASDNHFGKSPGFTLDEPRKKILPASSHSSIGWPRTITTVTLRDQLASSIVTQLRPARETYMLDKPTNHVEAASGWRFLPFLGFGDNRDRAAEPKAKKPPKEAEERKHQFATWYIFAAFLGLMLIQFLWLHFSQIETIPYSQFEQLLAENKISEVLVGTETIKGR